MDPHSLATLEFPKVRSLLAGYAATSLGRELVQAILPSVDADWIRNELSIVGEMVQTLDRGQLPPFAGVTDVRFLVRRASIGSMLTAEHLMEIAGVLSATGAFYRFRMRLDDRCGRLIDLLQPVEDLGPVAKSISGCIDSRNHVLDAASPELSAVRENLRAVDERIQNQVKRMLRDPELRRILRYPNATMSGDRYVLPVAATHRHKVPGVVHRTSPTGETVFVEPTAIANASAERAVYKGDEDREVRRVLRRLSADVARVSRPLSAALDVLARLDLITAKAKFSRDFRMSAPTVDDKQRLQMFQGRHPLLEQIFREKGAEGDRTVVPIDVRLGTEFDILVVTGPNTGGKTVALKTVGLLALMVQTGMHVPAGEGSVFPTFDEVLADIGDEQSLEQSLSTFSSHVSRIADILQRTSSRSLVLLDELGAGTDPTEGAALGRAILDHLCQTGCRAIVTTHLGDLKTYAFGNDRAENAAVEFDNETLRPTYRLLIGQFGMSNALKIANRMKLPPTLVRRAFEYLNREQSRAPELANLQQVREEMEKTRAEAADLKRQLELDRDELQRQMQAGERQSREEVALRVARENLKVDDAVQVPRFDKVGRVVRVDLKKRTATVAVGLGQWEFGLDELFPAS